MIVDKEPWHEKVDLNAALNEAVALMYLYTVITKEGIHAIVLWCAYTWFHEYGTVSPILNLFSPEKRCGKSTVLNVIKRFCKRSIVASNISPPAVNAGANPQLFAAGSLSLKIDLLPAH